MTLTPPPARGTRYPRVTKTLRPEQPGTLKLMRRFGTALVCVRYRIDGSGKHRCTTVELVIDEGPVMRRLSDRTIVHVPIAWAETDLRQRARALGAQWVPERKRYRMSMKTARMLGLANRLSPSELASLRRVK